MILLINSGDGGGPCGVFSLSRSCRSLHGCISKMSTSKGVNGDELKVEWNPCEHPHVLIRHNGMLNNVGRNYIFHVKVIVM
jgi:hypothetical protein